MTPEWRIDDALIAYPEALAAMESRVAAIRKGAAAEQIWLLSHPPLYTAGTSAKAEDLLDAQGLPVYETGRGGEYTYHGPGQRIAYIMLDVAARGQDVRLFVHCLENWVIAALDQFNIRGQRREGRAGVWVVGAQGEAKIAALGIRMRRWVSFHGVSINVDPDLERYTGIVPCGIRQYGVTSLDALGIPATLSDIDNALMASFDAAFAPMPYNRT